MPRRGSRRAGAWRFAAVRKSLAAVLFVAVGLTAVTTLVAGVGLSGPAFAKPRILKTAKPAAPVAAADPSADSLPTNADGTIGSGDDAGGAGNPSGSVETIDGDVDNPDNAADPAAAAKLTPSGDGLVTPKKALLAPPPPGPIADGPPLSFTLEARLTDASPPLTRGLSWRIFDAAPAADGKLKLVGEAHGGSVRLMLKPGSYFIHASYGRASAMRTITVGTGVENDNVVLNAGGLRLSAMVGKDQPLSATDVSFDIYAPDEDGAERSLLVSNAPAGHIIGLNAGTYHVVCHYGAANAIVRADIKIQPGKLTEAAVYQKAARLTLKLVSGQGGEAIANTAWSVVTPAGESIADFVGAFPSVVLAAGDYTAIAKHEGKMYERNFTVEPGLNHDIEVIAK